MKATPPRMEESVALYARQVEDVERRAKDPRGDAVRRLTWLAVFGVSATVWGILIFLIFYMFCRD